MAEFDFFALVNKESSEIGSDNCKTKSAAALRRAEVAGYDIRTDYSTKTIYTEELRAVIYNPRRNRLTFCGKDSQNQPTYSTFEFPATKISVRESPIEPLLEEIAHFLRERRNSQA